MEIILIIENLDTKLIFLSAPQTYVPSRWYISYDNWY